MTIPIRPGPFSFLLGAGQAAGSFGEALIAKHERERQQALQNAGLLQQLITGPNAVLDPSTMAPQLASSLGRLGIQGLTPQSIAPNPTVARNKAIAGMEAGPRKDIAQGIPTEADVAVNTAQGAEANVTNQVLHDLTPEQMQELRKVKSPELAKLLDNVQIEKVKTDLLAQDNNRLEDQVQATIRKDVLKRFPNDPQFRKIGDYAAIGGLGYLIGQLQESGAFARAGQQIDMEKIKAWTTLTTQAGSAYRQELNDWTEKRQAAIANVALNFDQEDIGSKEYNQAVDAAVKAFESNFPKPDIEKIKDAVIGASGISKQDYEAAGNAVIKASSKAGPTSSGGVRAKGVSDQQFNQIKALFQQGRFTADDVNNSESLSPDQKKQILAGKRTP